MTVSSTTLLSREFRSQTRNSRRATITVSWLSRWARSSSSFLDAPGAAVAPVVAIIEFSFCSPSYSGIGSFQRRLIRELYTILPQPLDNQHHPPQLLPTPRHSFAGQSCGVSGGSNFSELTVQ